MTAPTSSQRLFLSGLLCVLLLVSTFAPLQAAERQKASVVVIVVNNAATPYDAELTEKMTVWVERKFSGVYNLKPPAPFAAKLREIGASDLNGTKIAGIGEIFRPEGVDYVVYMELKPLTVHGHVAFFRYGKGVTADILLRMFDVAGGSFLYDAIVSQKAAKDEQSVFLDERIIALFSVNSKAIALDALDKSLFLAGEVISVKLPLDPRTIENAPAENSR